MPPPPDEIKLSREESEALIERIQASSLAGDDQRLLVKLIQLYFWLTVALRETKLSLKRLKRALFGEGKPPPPRPPTAGGPAGGVSPGVTAAGDTAGGGAGRTRRQRRASRCAGWAMGVRGRTPMPGRAREVCRQETLAAGQRVSGLWPGDVISVTGRGRDPD